MRKHQGGIQNSDTVYMHVTRLVSAVCMWPATKDLEHCPKAAAVN